MAEPEVRPPGAAYPSATQIYLVEIPLTVMTAGEWVRKAPSTAQRRLAGAAAGAATNEAATLTRAVYNNNTLLIKMTHDSTPVRLDVVRKTPKRNTWRMDLCQITVYDAL